MEQRNSRMPVFWFQRFNFFKFNSSYENLHRRANLARILLPPLIVLVVLGYEVFFIKLGDKNFQLWAHLLFYGIVGPSVTFYTISWILEGITLRQKAELELLQLYTELKHANRRLDTVSHLIRGLAEAGDLEEVLDAALLGISKATGAHSGLITLPGGIVRSIQSDGELQSSREGWDVSSVLSGFREGFYEVVLPLGWSGHEVGYLRLRYPEEPFSELRILLEALASEVGTALEAAQRRARDWITLYQVDQSIRAERNMDRLLERILTEMATRSGAEAKAAYLVDQDRVLRLVWGQDFSGKVFRGGGVSDFAQAVAAGRKPLRILDSLDPVFGQTASTVGLPMLSEGHVEGVIVLAYRERPRMDQARLPFLALLANQATLAVRNARAYLYSEELAIFDERSRIAREIHDGVAQSLAFIALKLDLVERVLLSDPEKAVSEVQFAAKTLREQIKEVRRSIFALRPIDLERLGLLETIRKYIQDFGEQHGLRPHLVTEEFHLPSGDEAIVFRILQESLNNVAKHAKASHIWVELRVTVSEDMSSRGRVILSVRDDGIGFDPKTLTGKVSSAGGLGLNQMRERVEQRGGDYRIVSVSGEGTWVHVELPLV